MKKTIGVFDSGVGGLSVANAIQAALPDYRVIYADDKANVPYGSKTHEELKKLVVPKLNMLSNQGASVIVIACNTVTTTIIEELRNAIAVPLVGMEPMVKPAARLTRTKKIAVCATPATLSSKRYRWLKETYAKGITVFEPDCSDWASMIESSRLDQDKIHSRIASVLSEDADVIVLGCTHYHWIENEIRQMARGKAKVLQPEAPVIARLKEVLSQQ